MGIAGGSGHFNNLIKDYLKNLKPFTAPHAERFPVILLVDNDSGADGIYRVVKATTKTACDGKESLMSPSPWRKAQKRRLSRFSMR